MQKRIHKCRKKKSSFATSFVVALLLIICIFATSAILMLVFNTYVSGATVIGETVRERFGNTNGQAYSPTEPHEDECNIASIRLTPPSTYHLDAFFSQFDADIGIYYKNLDTGFVYSFNPDGVFFGASLNKANLALHTFVAAERGYIDMYAVHTFTAEDWWGGTGIIRFMPAGTQFTTRELLHHSIVYSDNVAFRMLARYMARTGFSYRDFVAELGTNPHFIRCTYSHNTSAADTALWFYAIYNYIRSDSHYGHYLLNDLLNTALYSHPYFTRGYTFGGDSDVNVRFIHSGYPVAQKYGWFNRAFNTAGIVYAPSPFILVVVSNMHHGAHELFEEISWIMEEFNGRYF